MPEITHIVGRIAAAIFGAIAGAILTALIVWVVCRMTVKKQPPKPVRKMLRILGAIAGAMAAVLFLPIGYGGFGLGNFGLGLGPGGGGFSLSASAPTTPSKPELKPAREPDTRPVMRARIVMLGGPLVVGEACYRIEDERAAKTLVDVQSHLRAGMKREPPVNVLEVRIHDDSLARRSAQVVRLSDWATQAGLRVEIELVSGNIPP